jgi:STE24 endopeptidase
MYIQLSLVFAILMIFGFLIEKILEFLNASYYGKKAPDFIREHYSQDEEQKNLKYKRVKFKFAMIESILGFIATFLFWYLGGFGWLTVWVESIVNSVFLQSLLFFGVIAFVSGIASIPFSYYFNFVIEEGFGFNKMTRKTFVFDLLKSSLLAVVLGGGILSFIIWVYLAAPLHFWWIVWIALSSFMIFMTAFYAQLIVPLFNKQKPLQEGELKDKIMKMADQLQFKLNHIFVMDGSKRSSKANAYFTGLGKQKRIVLYDTLINDLETDEVIAVLAHEVGHYKHRHTLFNIIIGLFSTGLMLYILSLFIAPNSEISILLNQVVTRDQELQSASFFLGLIGFGILYAPVSMVLGILMNVLSRRFEYQADAFAAKYNLDEQLQSGLIKLSKNSLSNLTPHPAYVFVNFSHPTLVQRMEALRSKK